MRLAQQFQFIARAIGQRRTRLVLEKPTEAADGAGGVTRNYASLGTVWASLQMRGSEVGRGPDQDGAILTHWITIRYRADVTTGCRFRAGTRVFAIRGLADPDERRRNLICFCEEERP